MKEKPQFFVKLMRKLPICRKIRQFDGIFRFVQSFFPMGQKALQKSFATSHGKKSFAKLEKFRQIDEIFSKLAIFLSIWRKIVVFPSIWRKYSLISRNKGCKCFYPMGKKSLQASSLFSNQYKNTTARSLFGMQRFCYIPHNDRAIYL